ncbi:medium-chain acyl-[acyl-carrier-protein] hydrolase [Nannocystis exedens]|uniref:Medium-chain acyl-[acyl-carrier-protein] hydrolase n=1 Tax=Nannocystis exedens TaxID=54 RepID=A0A1I2I1R4_9BACT|nr:alpha/beta fold hydrolase [Nannocystis exedens]PCC68474.1 oleoyl-ACP hydrolase [Nannocystis exedens]SFF36142.1 medium-chain acyl-[acyl-carrier-protein] hydrolase [Nannocystis exedens]
MHPRPTLRILRAAERPRVRLLCLPCAGGGAGTFSRWRAVVPADVELVAAQLPARQDRLGEPPCTRVAAIVELLAAELRRLRPAPLALFGHSFGALVGFELARLAAGAGASPVLLTVAAALAPQRVRGGVPLHRLADADLLAAMENWFGARYGELADPELVAAVLRPLRADLEALETYTFVPGPALPCRLAVHGGRADDSLAPEELRAWQQHGAGEFREHWFDAGHFLVDERWREVALTTLADLDAAMQDRPAAAPSWAVP